jgi:PKD repeat protein
MRKINFIVAIVVMFVVSALSLYAIEVSPAGRHYVGDTLSFTPTNSTFGRLNTADWNFGDGTTLTVTYGMSTVTHSYANAGTYLVRVTGNPGGAAPLTETVSVLIEQPVDNRYIGVTPAQPIVGQPATFTAYNFNTPDNIVWDMGDGTILSIKSQQPGFTANRPRNAGRQRAGIMGTNVVTHTYTAPGNYTVRAYDFHGDTNQPVTLNITVQMPNRRIIYQPTSPRVDQPVYFQAQDFITTSITWNFGDGTTMAGGTTVTHRFMTQGTYTVSARESALNYPSVTTTITVLPENRYIVVSPPEVRTNEIVTATAVNFRGDYILWNFGDGTQRAGLHSETHQYRRAGTYIITAQDENGESQVQFTAQVTVKGIDDRVNLEIAEISLDNGKYYKIVPKNSKNIRAVLRMKMNGTGIVSGYWIVDGHPFEFFNEVAYQGEVKEIYTRQVPGLPVIDPGIHTITVRLTRPVEIPVTFPILKYFVLPHENILKTLTPPDGFIAKENEIPEFTWEEPRGASKYQIAFANYLYIIMNETSGLNWIDVGPVLTYTPGPDTWKNIKRNRWTYWKVRALDTVGNIVAESDAQDIKVVVATANINIEKAVDLEGNGIAIVDGSSIDTRADDILVHGSIEYLGDSRYLVLRVYVDDELVDQLLFRDVKKNEVRRFETSIPNKKKMSKVFFKVLKTSSPAVIVGIKGLILKK